MYPTLACSCNYSSFIVQGSRLFNECTFSTGACVCIALERQITLLENTIPLILYSDV